MASVKYEAAFRENAIDLSILLDLTDQDLEKIGVLLGHRRKLLRVIANLETQKASASTVASPATTDASPRDAAERRQVTVMFSDLVGSTALSARMDPEDLREIISAYQKCVADTVQRFGGFVAKYMGDGVLVYFGYPQAHEDDAERAVRTAVFPNGRRTQGFDPRSRCGRIRWVHLVSFLLPWLGGLLIPLFEPMPSSGRLNLLLKSAGPPPIILSLNVQGDAAHDNSRFIKP